MLVLSIGNMLKLLRERRLLCKKEACLY